MAFSTWLRRSFVAGLLVVLPLVGAVAVFWWLVRIATDTGFAVLQKRWPYFADLMAENETLYAVIGRAFVFVVLVAVTVLIGAVTRNVLGVRVVRVWERVLLRIPLFNRIYSMLRQLSHAIWGQGSTVFSQVVMVEFPRKGLYSVGFITSYPKGEIQKKTREEVVTVFVPTAPNPTTGFFVVVPREEVVPLSMRVEDGLKMVISAGAVLPEESPGPVADAEAEGKVAAGAASQAATEKQA